MSIDKERFDRRTRAVHAGIRRSSYGEVSEALFLTQGFAYASAADAAARFDDPQPDEYSYSRNGNPTVAMFEDRIAAIEGAEAALATATGMAAVSGALMSFLKSGDRVVAARALFGSNLSVLFDVLGRFGVETVLVDGTNLDQWRAAVTPGTAAVFFETISNPTLEVADLAAISEIARAAGARVIIDNVFATPVFSRSFELGADLVVYSATKHVDGGGRVLGGVILGRRDFLTDTVAPYLGYTGGVMDPFAAWVMLKGVETMELRVRAQAEGALALAGSLAREAKVARVLYPGLADHPGHRMALDQYGTGGTVLSFDLGSREAAFRFMDALELIVISNNLGDAKSIVTHPATTTHHRVSDEDKEALGITPGLIRFSVGLEAVGDLLADIARGLARV